MTSWILNDTPSKVFPLYSRANVGEVFPDPISPLNATTGFLANLEPGWCDAYVACQVWDHDIYDDAVEHNPIACFGGYLFINMSLMRLFGVRVPGFSPEAVDLQYFGDMPGIPSYASEARAFDESPEWSERSGAWLVGDVLGCSTSCYSSTMAREITQRELRNASGEIMRKLDEGETFIVTRNGVPVGELTPLRRHRFVAAEAAVALFRTAPGVEYERFRADIDAAAGQDPTPRA